MYRWRFQDLFVAKQVMELGGWDNIKVAAVTTGAAAVNQPGAQGWYLAARWFSGLQTPGGLKLENDYQAMFNMKPNINVVYFYDPICTAVEAIKLAGTDTDRGKIAEVAHSGNLEWEAPEGHVRFNTDGTSNTPMNLARIENKTVVPVIVPE